MKPTYRIDGLTEVRATLAALPEGVRSIIGEEFARGAREILDGARQRVPVRDGDLVRSLGSNVREDGLQATVGSGLLYSRFVELGTSDTPKQPFLYPPFRIFARTFRKRMKDTEPRLRAKIKRGRKAAK